MSNSFDSTSLCRRSRITESIHVATLAKFISSAIPSDDLWMDCQ